MSQISASALYAIATGGNNEGQEECYWCADPAPRLWKHGEPPAVPFTRHVTPARRPSSNYLCYGCWRFGWKRTTLPYLSGGFRDGQCAQHHSLWITEQGVWAVRTGDLLDRAALYDLLLKPPLRFILALREDMQGSNLLGLFLANDHVHGVQADTRLRFTINHVPHDYTPYELEEGLRNGTQGKAPGVSALIRVLGEYKLPPKDGGRPEKMERGRPKPLEDGKQLQKVLAGKSGG